MPTVECETKTTGQARLLEYFGLREQPFGVTPDPRFLYFSPSHREAFASLIYAIETKRGFSALIAEPGMGKTSLLFHLLGKIHPSARTAFLFRPESDQYGLLRSLLTDLGVKTEFESVSQMHETLNRLLLLESRGGRQLVLVIDEAQDLDDSVLESVRLLSNFETTTSKLIHIVLAGQPTLADRLAKPQLVQLRQRISAWAALDPFTRNDCARYIDHRLRIAGFRGTNLFPDASKLLIASASLGLPRNINNICFACLSLCFANQQQQATTGIVREVLRDQKLEKTERVGTKLPRGISQTPFLPPLQEPRARRRSGHLGIAIFSLILIPLALVFLVSEAKLDVSQTNSPGVAEEILYRLTGRPIQPAEPPPSLPLPAPPVADPSPQTQDAQPDSSTTSSEPPPPTEHEQIAAGQTRTVPSERVNPRAHRSTRVVVVTRQENLFELAMEHYGRANWEIVEKIREQNPGITNSLSYVREGQSVVLPDLGPQFPWKEEGHSSSSFRTRSSTFRSR
ncbi:MAG TPA: AAA family ATPase [Candidatus Acidoferrum sp.]|nr:AAA family ATPase [Candidatus Acidoferrum sp.]